MGVTHLEDLRRLHHFLSSALFQLGHGHIDLHLQIFSDTGPGPYVFMSLKARPSWLSLVVRPRRTFVSVPTPIANAPGVVAAFTELRNRSLAQGYTDMIGCFWSAATITAFMADVEALLASNDPTYTQPVVTTLKGNKSR